jgi:hypothetical protein
MVDPCRITLISQNAINMGQNTVTNESVQFLSIALLPVMLNHSPTSGLVLLLFWF